MCTGEGLFMVKRWCFACSFVFLIAALVYPLGGTAAAAPLAGAFTTGTDTAGHHYGFYSLAAPATVTSVTTTFAPGTASASIQCDAAAPNARHGVGNANDPYEWQPVWGLSNPTGSVTVGARCTTQWVRVDVGNAAPPTAMSVSGTTAAGDPTPTATKAIPTATMVMPTATMTGHGGGACTGYGDHAVDQN